MTITSRGVSFEERGGTTDRRKATSSKGKMRLLCIEDYTTKVLFLCRLAGLPCVGLWLGFRLPRIFGRFIVLRCGRGLTDRAIGLSKVQEADMPAFGTADACIDRLLANRTVFHELLYPYQGQLLQWTALGKTHCCHFLAASQRGRNNMGSVPTFLSSPIKLNRL
jgi:hypothetical protein